MMMLMMIMMMIMMMMIMMVVVALVISCNNGGRDEYHLKLVYHNEIIFKSTIINLNHHSLYYHVGHQFMFKS